jgi:hypothetical protein
MTDDLDPTTAIPTPAAPLTPAVPSASAGGGASTPSSPEPGLPWTSAAPVASVAPVLPVVASNAGPRRGRLRWAAAIAVVALVIGTSVAVAGLIAGRSSESTVLGYVPVETVVYGEVRLDLPGDQRRAVGEFLSKFPGFADQAALDSKLDEVLDEIVSGATDGTQSYSANIKPWFDGELAMSVGPLPPTSSVLGGKASMEDARALALMSIKDAAAATAWFEAAIAKSGATTTTESYGGATLTVFTETDGVKAAFALLDGKAAVLGDLTSVKAAVDTKGVSGFASEPGPKAALASSTGDHVGFAYVALRPLLDWSTKLGTSASPEVGGAAAAGLADSFGKLLPAWTAFWLRFESDAVVMEATAPKTATSGSATEDRTSNVVDHVPGSAMIAVIGHDLGKSLKETLDRFGSDSTLKPALEQLDQVLSLVGGMDGAFDWAGDSAVVIDAPDGTPTGGVVIEPTDKAAADRLFNALRTLIALGGGSQGITTREESYGGTTITIVDLGDLGKLPGMPADGGAGSSLPTGRVEIAFAVTDEVVVIGLGPTFVKHVIDTTKATSLASDEQYRELAGRIGKNSGSTFADITALRLTLEKAAVGVADPADVARYEKDLKPFLVPFDAMIAAGSTDGEIMRSEVIITVN